jgi:hypothetical protein
MLVPKEIVKNGKKAFQVEYPPYEGKRKREVFSGKLGEKDAKAACDKYEKEVKRAGEWWARLEPAERRAIELVCTEIKDAGETITQVWEERKKAKTEQAAQLSKTQMPYEDVVTEWKRRKLNSGKSAKYVYHAGQDLMKFAAGQERRPIHEFPVKQLDTWLHAQTIQKPGKDFGKPWGLSTKRTWMSLFHGLWEVAVTLDWASVNIVDKLEPIDKPSRIKKIYPNETTRNLMAAALENKKTQDGLLPLVLGFFGCMRPEEITSEKPKEKKLPRERWFDWHNINLETGQIDVSVDVAKTGDERVITLQPCAIEWLKLAKKLECPLPPKNEFKVKRVICELIGLDEWFRDSLRKNCATHLRAVYKNDYDVIRDLGNSVRELLKSYADLKTPEAVSLEHWMITPAMVEEYRKSRDWKKVLREAGEKADAKRKAEIKAKLEAEGATAAFEATPAPSANETATSGH